MEQGDARLPAASGPAGRRRTEAEEERAMNLLLQRLLDHNLYATRLTLETCRGLSSDQFHQRFEIGPGSLHDTLRHVVGAMLRWSDRIMQREVRPSIEQPGARFSVDDLLRLLEQGD